MTSYGQLNSNSAPSIPSMTAAQAFILELIRQPTSRQSLSSLRSPLAPTLLKELELVGLIRFNERESWVEVCNDHPIMPHLKRLSSYLDLLPVISRLQAVSIYGALFGSRGRGDFHTESDYDLFVVSDRGSEVKKLIQEESLASKIELVLFSETEFDSISKDDPALVKKLATGFRLWGADPVQLR